MSFDPISAALDLGRVAIERIWPDPQKRAEEFLKLEQLKQSGQLAELQAHVQLLLAQAEINKAEAAHRSLFVSGWRPAIGWVCASILAFNYIGVYLMGYLTLLAGAPAAPGPIDMTDLWPVLLGMLGIGGMRTFEKVKGVETTSLGK